MSDRRTPDPATSDLASYDRQARLGRDRSDAFFASDGATCFVIGAVAAHIGEAAATMGQLCNVLRGVAYCARERSSSILGVGPGTQRTDHVVVLGPAATVLLYTDGLLERRGASLDDGLALLALRAADDHRPGRADAGAQSLRWQPVESTRG